MKSFLILVFSTLCSFQAFSSISPLAKVEVSEFASKDETLSVVFQRLSKTWELSAPYEINFSFSPPSLNEIESPSFSYRNLPFDRLVQFVTQQNGLDYGIDETRERSKDSLHYIIYKPIEVKEVEVWMQRPQRSDPFESVSTSESSVPVTIAQAIKGDEAVRSLSYLYIRNKNGEWGNFAVSRLNRYFKDVEASKSIQGTGDVLTVLYRLHTNKGLIYISFDSNGWRLLNIGDKVIWQDRGDLSSRDNALRFISAGLYGLLPPWFVIDNDLKQDFRLISSN